MDAKVVTLFNLKCLIILDTGSISKKRVTNIACEDHYIEQNTSLRKQKRIYILKLGMEISFVFLASWNDKLTAQLKESKENKLTKLDVREHVDCPRHSSRVLWVLVFNQSENFTKVSCSSIKKIIIIHNQNLIFISRRFPKSRKRNSTNQAE